MDKHCEEYIKFIKDQLVYFDTKSIKEKRKYLMYSTIAIVANALIPIMTTFSSIPSPYKQIVAILSAISAIANGLAMTFDSGTIWKSYRNIFTELQTVLRAYTSQAGDYHGLNEEEAFELLYKQSEAVLRDDREKWFNNNSKDKK